MRERNQSGRGGKRDSAPAEAPSECRYVLAARATAEQVRGLSATPVEVRRRYRLNCDLHQVRRELVRVVPTEDQLTTTGEYDAKLAGRIAAVASLLGRGGCRSFGRGRDRGGHRLVLLNVVRQRANAGSTFFLHRSFN